MSLSAEMPANYEMMISHGPSVYSHSPPSAFLADYSNGNYSFFDHQPVRSCRPQVLTPPQQRRKFPNQLQQNVYNNTILNNNLNNYNNNNECKVKQVPKSCLIIRSSYEDDHDTTTITTDEIQHVKGKPSSRIKKKVAFADDKGYSLTQIRYMSEPSNVPPYWTLKFLAQITQGLVSPHPSEQWVVDFKQPASDYLQFRKKIDTNNVSLENVIIKENESIVVGTVKVKNINFEKEVIVRVTWDNWKSQQDIFCTYSEIYGPSSAYVIYDTFSFKITLPPSSKKLEFCICFRTDGKEYWDNNDKKNYIISKRLNVAEDYQSYKNYINTGNHTPLSAGNKTSCHNDSDPIAIKKNLNEYKSSQSWPNLSEWDQNQLTRPYW